MTVSLSCKASVFVSGLIWGSVQQVSLASGMIVGAEILRDCDKLVAQVLFEEPTLPLQQEDNDISYNNNGFRLEGPQP